MKSTIKSISLCNWFTYKGDYDDNSFIFEPGFNIIVAANDVGKTKLHNAFRWILENKVIVRNPNGNSEQKYSEVEPNERNILSNNQRSGILNNKAFSTTPINEEVKFGVKLIYQYENRTIKKERVLIKEIVLRKHDDNTITILRTNKIVKKIERNNIRSCSDDFDDCLKNIIPNNLRSFFLVQGETLDFMTPLGGDRLKATLTKFIDISILSSFLESSENSKDKLVELRSQYEKKDAQGEENREIYTKKKQQLETQIKDDEKEFVEVEELLGFAKSKVESLKNKAANSEKKQQLQKEIEKFDKDIAKKDTLIEHEFKYLKENFVKNEFYLRRLIDSSESNKSISQFILKCNDLISKRRSELQDKLNQEEQDMLYALDKSQPKPEILNQMLNKGKCYVCSNDIDNKSRKYINEILIPYFKGELMGQKDKHIFVYENIAEFFKSFKIMNIEPKDFVKQKIEEISKYQEKIVRIEEEREEFISEHGDVKISESDSVNMTTFSQALKDLLKFEKEFNDLDKNISENREKLRLLKENQPKSTKESKETIKAKNLENFNYNLNNVLVDIIDNDYKKFKNELEKEVKLNFKKFTEHNKNLNSQNIEIDYSLNAKKEPNFSVKVVDQMGNNMSDGGGASQTIRQLSLIFGLMKYANNIYSQKQLNYPFIADAPTSNMTSTLAFSFYENQLINAKNQNILITKELWDDRNNSLNKEGELLSEKVEEYKDATFTLLLSKKNNDLSKNDVIISKIK